MTDKNSRALNQSLLVQEHVLSMALESIAESISITDENNIILYVNRAFLRTYGYTQQEIIGQHINCVRKEPFEQSKDYILVQTQEGGWKGEIINLRKNGEEFIISLSTSIISDKDGTYLGLIGVASDITEKKRASEAYKVLVDHSIQGLLLLLDNKIIFSNQRASEIIGNEKEQLVTWTFTELQQIFHPLERKVFIEMFNNVADSEEDTIQAEYRILSVDGEQKWIQLSASKISFITKSAVQLAFIDITTKKSAELGFNRIHNQVQKQNIVFEELLRSDLSDYQGSLSKIVEIAANTMKVDMVSIWIFGNDETQLECIDMYNSTSNTHSHGNILQYAANPEYFNSLNNERILTVYDVNTDNRTQGFAPYLKLLNVKSLLDVKIGYGKGFSGVICFEECQNYRFWQEDEIAFAVRVVDVVSFLMEANKRNETEVALRESEKKLLEVVHTKDKFFSILAHDLKNPYNAISGFAELLHHEYDNYSDTEKKVIIRNIHDSAENTYKLLENLLDWAFIQSGLNSFKPEYTDISTLVNETVLLLKPQADNKKILIFSEVNFNSDAWIDGNMIKTVLRNLISNAIHYSNLGGRIHIGAEIIQQQNKEYYKIKVSDQGVGITTENLQRLFKIGEKFQTTGTSGERGTGLGLFLCHDFIKANKGNIWVESKEGKGSNFYFTLPLHP